MELNQGKLTINHGESSIGLAIRAASRIWASTSCTSAVAWLANEGSRILVVSTIAFAYA